MLFTWILACTPEGEKSDAPPINQDDTAFSCSGTPPVITSLVFENLGMYEFEGGDQPAFKVTASFTDADADLTTVSMHLWSDVVVDGTVDTNGEYEGGDPYLFTDRECMASSRSYGLAFGVTSSSWGFATEYEFAATVLDVNDEESEPAITSGWTPNSDGSDGTPSG